MDVEEALRPRNDGERRWMRRPRVSEECPPVTDIVCICVLKDWMMEGVRFLACGLVGFGQFGLRGS